MEDRKDTLLDPQDPNKAVAAALFLAHSAGYVMIGRPGQLMTVERGQHILYFEPSANPDALFHAVLSVVRGER